jgi:hypothetical protein
MHLLEGWCFGNTDRAAAVEGLRYVVERTKEARHVSHIVPASLRLMDLLLQAGRDDEARLAIEQFEGRFPLERHHLDGPSVTQLKKLQDLKSLLWETRSLKVST